MQTENWAKSALGEEGGELVLGEHRALHRRVHDREVGGEARGPEGGEPQKLPQSMFQGSRPVSREAK